MTVGKLWRPEEEEEAMQIGGIGAMLNIQFAAHKHTTHKGKYKYSDVNWRDWRNFAFFGYISVSTNDLLG